VFDNVKLMVLLSGDLIPLLLVKYTDRKAVEDISGILCSKESVQGLPYSAYFSTYKLTDVCEIELMISHYIHHKAFKNLESWTIKSALVKQ
jgi:hypothetical protein